MTRRRAWPVLLLVPLLTLALGACGDDDGNGADGGAGETVTLVTHDSFAVSKPVLRAFTEETGIRVEVLRSGDAGAAVNQAILTKDDPLGDVFFGVDNTFLTRALDAGIFERYVARDLDTVPAALRLDDRERVTPIDYGDVCVNYDKAWFADEGVAPPSTLDDLIAPAYRGRLVVENPATSSPGLAFLLATVARYGEDGWEAYWERLRDNDVEVVDGWEEAYNGEFSAGSGNGDFPLVVSYASSPPVEVLYAEPRPNDAPTAVLTDTCFRQVEFAGVLQNAGNGRGARRLVDFMLGERFQADVPLQMFVFPARAGTPLPPVFRQYAAVPEDPLTLPPAEIGEQRDEWIEQWTSIVLR
jgi:thiamine transport system substrate-binding protein